MMKATGIIRRVDDLGRIVLPKEIRRTLQLHEGDPIEIFVDRAGKVILKKYSPIAELANFVQECAESLHEAVGHIAMVANCDSIIAVAGAPKEEVLNKPTGNLLCQALENRNIILLNKLEAGDDTLHIVQGDGRYDVNPLVIAPIITQGDPIGAVIIISKDPAVKLGEVEIKLAETAASFLAKHMEQ